LSTSNKENDYDDDDDDDDEGKVTTVTTAPDDGMFGTQLQPALVLEEPSDGS